MGTAETDGNPAETLATPSLEVAGLRFWLHHRLHPSAHDPDEGNLISATIRCDSEDLGVKAEGASIRTSDIARWAKDCRALHKGDTALARFSLKKGIFEIILQAADDLSRIIMRVAVSPGEGAPPQSFEFGLERGDLLEIVRQCEEILAAFPVRGTSLPEAA